MKHFREQYKSKVYLPKGRSIFDAQDKWKLADWNGIKIQSTVIGGCVSDLERCESCYVAHCRNIFVKVVLLYEFFIAFNEM